MNYIKILKPTYVINRIKQYKEKLPIGYDIPILFLLCDMIYCFFSTGCTVKDYMMYEFYKLNRYGKRQFITGCKMDKWYKKIIQFCQMN